MVLALFKRLLNIANKPKLIVLKTGKTFRLAQFECTFFGEDESVKGSVFLIHKTNTYSCFSLTMYGLVSATSPQGVFWQQTSGELLIDFDINFIEGEEVDYLKGTLTLLDWLLPENKGRWIASVRSSGHEVATVKGTWLRHKL